MLERRRRRGASERERSRSQPGDGARSLMVEVALNLFWLLIVLASVVAWARSRHRLLSERRRQLSAEIFGLAIAMMLLWAPVSLTDNLHPVIFQAEDGGVTKRIARLCARTQLPNHQGRVPPPPAFFPIRQPAFTLNILRLLVRRPSASLLITLTGNLLSNRAPPSL